MDNLKRELYLLYTKELTSLNLGHEMNKHVLKKMLSIIGDIYIKKINLYG